MLRKLKTGCNFISTKHLVADLVAERERGREEEREREEDDKNVQQYGEELESRAPADDIKRAPVRYDVCVQQRCRRVTRCNANQGGLELLL